MERINLPLKGLSDDDDDDENDVQESQRALLSSSDTSETETDNNGRSGGDNNANEHDHPAIKPHPALAYLQRHADFILMPVLPILWCLLLVTTLNRDDFLSALGMPLLGIMSATMANAVPGA